MVFIISVHQKLINSNRYLKFRSDHPLERQQTFVRSLIDRIIVLCFITKNCEDEIKHPKVSLKLKS